MSQVLQFNPEDFLVIPQSNVKKGEASLDKLVSVVQEPKANTDLVYDPKKENFKVKAKFMKDKKEGEGFTAFKHKANDTALIVKTDESAPEHLKPMFLKGSSPYFNSDYLKEISVDILGVNSFALIPCKVGEYDAYLLSVEAVAGSKSSDESSDNENQSVDPIADCTNEAPVAEVTIIVEGVNEVPQEGLIVESESSKEESTDIVDPVISNDEVENTIQEESAVEQEEVDSDQEQLNEEEIEAAIEQKVQEQQVVEVVVPEPNLF